MRRRIPASTGRFCRAMRLIFLGDSRFGDGARGAELLCLVDYGALSGLLPAFAGRVRPGEIALRSRCWVNLGSDWAVSTKVNFDSRLAGLQGRSIAGLFF